MASTQGAAEKCESSICLKQTHFRFLSNLAQALQRSATIAHSLGTEAEVEAGGKDAQDAHRIQMGLLCCPGRAQGCGRGLVGFEQRLATNPEAGLGLPRSGERRNGLGEARR